MKDFLRKFGAVSAASLMLYALSWKEKTEIKFPIHIFKCNYSFYLAKQGEKVRDLWINEGGDVKDSNGFKSFCVSIYKRTKEIEEYPSQHLFMDNDTLVLEYGGFIEVPDLNLSTGNNSRIALEDVMERIEEYLPKSD
ncbi:MAG: hypothetical protein AABW50_05470 [Nanoarchaeota archaeon]